MKLYKMIFGEDSNHEFSPATRKYYFEYVK